MNRMVSLPLFVLAVSAVPTLASPIQWRTEDGGNGHWYEVKTTSPHISWFEARDQAAASGGYLATITSQAENQFVWDALQIGSTESYWADFYDGPLFGGYRAETNTAWQWVTGEQWSYSNFNWATQAGFAATQFIAHSSSWDDVPPFGGSAGGNVSYVVEFNTPSPSAGLTLLGGLLCAKRRCRARA